MQEFAEHDERAEEEHLDEAFAAFGLLPDRAVPVRLACFYLWPENVPAWRFFRSCSTQWRHGFNGPTGLDYASVNVLIEQLHPRKRARMWELVRAMEHGALVGWDQLRAEQTRD